MPDGRAKTESLFHECVWRTRARVDALRYTGISCLLFSLLACGPPDNLGDSARRTGGTVPEGRKIVRFWHTWGMGNARRVIDEVIGDFNREQTKHWVEPTSIPWTQVDQKILISAAGGVPPDITMMAEFQIAPYASRYALECLDPLVAEGRLNPKDYMDVTWDAGLYDGKLYGVPLAHDLRALFYNKEMFREAGLDSERPPRTWKELWEYAKRFERKADDGHYTRMGFSPLWGNTWLFLYGWQKGARFMSPGGRRVTCADPGIVSALEWVNQWYERYGVEEIQGMQSSFGGFGQDPFITGRVAMFTNCYGYMKDLTRYAPDLDYGIAEPPHPEDGVRATWTGVWMLLIPVGVVNPEGARTFLEYLLRTDVQIKLAVNTDILPASEAAARDPYFQDNPKRRACIEMMEITRIRPITPIGKLLWDEMERATNRAIYGQGEPEEVLREAQEKIQTALDRQQRLEAVRRRAMEKRL